MISCLTVALTSKVRFIFEKYLVDNILNENFNNYADQCMDIINQLIMHNKNTGEFYLQRAILYFHYRKINEAKDSVKTANDLSPKNDPSPFLSFAFLALWTEEYSIALNNYIRAEKYRKQDVKVTMQVLTFLQAVTRAHPEKVQIKFGLAFVNDKHFDTLQAKKDYKEFIDLNGNNPKLDNLISYAVRRLNELEPKENTDEV